MANHPICHLKQVAFLASSAFRPCPLSLGYPREKSVSLHIQSPVASRHEHKLFYILYFTPAVFALKLGP